MIPEVVVNSVLDEISTEDGGGREFQHPVTDEQLRAFISAAKTACDVAEVPEVVAEVNFADEFDKAVDESLGDQPADP